MQDLQIANEQRLDALRDFLELPVALRVELGRTKLTARQILELQPNAIVKLRRAAGEAVDVVIDNRVLARGEITIVENAAAVRLNQICSAENQ